MHTSSIEHLYNGVAWSKCSFSTDFGSSNDAWRTFWWYVTYCEHLCSRTYRNLMVEQVVQHTQKFHCRAGCVAHTELSLVGRLCGIDRNVTTGQVMQHRQNSHHWADCVASTELSPLGKLCGIDRTLTTGQVVWHRQNSHHWAGCMASPLGRSCSTDRNGIIEHTTHTEFSPFSRSCSIHRYRTIGHAVHIEIWPLGRWWGTTGRQSQTITQHSPLHYLQSIESM